ncbi:hypothetical protein GGR92_001932 [Spirosoma lacussanchae]|uniref:hypothetical protein n=1 Tax=Spirosoma lacussanchae TaxID=1884249 RepID=UPI001107BDEB|nr:hypothetical protein [Spirosoma lacussanchae]
MNTLSLDNFDVVEMDEYAIQQTQGGTPIHVAILIGVAIAAATEIIQDWDNFKAGLSGNCKQAKK